LIRQIKFFRRSTKSRLAEPSEICALDFKHEFRRSAICSVSRTIGIDRSIFRHPRLLTTVRFTGEKRPSALTFYGKGRWSFRTADCIGPAKRIDQEGTYLSLTVSLPIAIYEMEKRGDFPRRFNLTPWCVVRDLDEVEALLEQRRQACLEGHAKTAAGPDVHQRKTRPVKTAAD
jgi:predicted DNA-binding transcriptional regulator AlpA